MLSFNFSVALHQSLIIYIHLVFYTFLFDYKSILTFSFLLFSFFSHVISLEIFFIHKLGSNHNDMFYCKQVQNNLIQTCTLKKLSEADTSPQKMNYILPYHLQNYIWKTSTFVIN